MASSNCITKRELSKNLFTGIKFTLRGKAFLGWAEKPVFSGGGEQQQLPLDGEGSAGRAGAAPLLAPPVPRRWDGEAGRVIEQAPRSPCRIF